MERISGYLPTKVEVFANSRINDQHKEMIALSELPITNLLSEIRLAHRKPSFLASDESAEEK
jgi:hypothetical protein